MKTIEKSAIFNFEADKNRLLEQIREFDTSQKILMR